MGCLFFSLWLIELNTAPVDTVFYNCFGEKLHSVKRPFFIFFKSGTVNDIADMFFSARSFWVNIFFHTVSIPKGIQVFLTSFKEEHNSNYLAAVRANSVLTKLV